MPTESTGAIGKTGLETFPAPETKPWSARLKAIIFAAELAFVVGLLVFWLSSESARASQNLWFLFLYCFPAQFIVATVPIEPVLLYFSRFHPPLTICLVSLAGTILVEILNYTMFKYVADLKILQGMLESRIVRKTLLWFKKAPFAVLWVAGFTPIPFYPCRFLVVLARYPLWKYILAVATSRTPRFYILAVFGKAVGMPNWVLLVIFVVFVIVGLITVMRKVLKRKHVEHQ